MLSANTTTTVSRLPIYEADAFRLDAARRGLTVSSALRLLIQTHLGIS